ncbi:MAG: hypothetical protein ABTQ29_08905 [Siculibacillus sp.]
MFPRTIAPLALATAVFLPATMPSTSASATPAGAVVAAGVVGAVWGAGLASAHGGTLDGGWVEGAPVHYHGVPGYQRRVVLQPVVHPTRAGRTAVYVPAPGPGRQTTCAWQPRYDRHEHYVGSRKICWVEAY